MSAFGSIVPGGRIRKESPEDSGSGQGGLRPIDLDGGVVYLTNTRQRESNPESEPESEPESPDR